MGQSHTHHHLRERNSRGRESFSTILRINTQLHVISMQLYGLCEEEGQRGRQLKASNSLPLLAMPLSSLTHTAVPLGVDAVAGVAVTGVATLAVDALPMTTDVPVEPAFVCLCCREGAQSTSTSDWLSLHTAALHRAASGRQPHREVLNGTRGFARHCSGTHVRPASAPPQRGPSPRSP